MLTTMSRLTYVNQIVNLALDPLLLSFTIPLILGKLNPFGAAQDKP